ncbi:hypothetical protein [Aquimarina latercula]|uniref:hypothetical protein n=1 Tax=Aquimarina latercula TaxID=987 RepID=UPI00040E77C6|nr:hypothetical protein [Aquimarina latercula]
MKNISVDYKYLTLDLIKAIAKEYPNGFKEMDVITLSEVNSELQDRVRLVINDTLFLIKKTELEEAMSDKFDDEYFDTLKTQSKESCDAEFCEED